MMGEVAGGSDEMQQASFAPPGSGRLSNQFRRQLEVELAYVHPAFMLTGQMSYQLSAVSYQLSAISYQPTRCCLEPTELTAES